MPISETHNIDCMEYMKTLPDNAFDLAVADPPYGGGFTEGGGCQGWFSKYHQDREEKPKRELGAHFVGRGRGKRYAEIYEQDEACSQIGNVEREREQGEPRYNRFGSPGSRFERYKREQDGETKKKIIAWDVAPDEEYFKELFRVSRNQIIWGGNYFALPPTRCFLVWRKLSISESFTMAMAEYAWTSFNANAKVFECAPQGKVGDPRFHPTAKPIALYKWIFQHYAKPGDKILDTHLGSGSSRIAAWDMGFDFVGCEIDKTYFELEEERFRKHTAQTRMF